MELIIYGPIWGMTGMKLEDALAKLRDAGYHGAEIALDPDTDNLYKVKECFDNQCMRMIAQHPFARGENPEKYKQDYISKLLRITAIGPDLINCHTGRDDYAFSDNLKIIEAAEKVAADLKCVIAHEIHRGRFSYSPGVIRDYLEYFPSMNLTADFSHWCVVTESLLEDRDDILDLAISRMRPHSRPGGEQPVGTGYPSGRSGEP